MYNYILSAGLTVVANGAFAHNVDIESTAGRQLVYRGLRAWQRDVFAANERGLISEQEKVSIFSEVKTVAVDNYNIAREELVNNVVEETIVVIDEIAELKAAMRLMAEQVQALQKDAKIQKDSYDQLAKAVVLENRTGIKNKIYQEVVSKVGI